MASKAFLVFCAQILLIKAVFSQCNNNLVLNNGLSGLSINQANLGTIPASNIGCGNNLNLANLNSNILDNYNGGVFSVSSGSNISPNGITVISDNLLVDGSVGVTGNLPLLGAVAVDGNLPAGGQAAVVYNAGNGVSLTNGGCGMGLAGINNNGLAYGNGNLAGLNNANLLGVNNLNGLNNLNLAGLNGVRLSNSCGL